MRICFICESKSIHSKRWVNFFLKQGHESHVITPSPPEPEKIDGAILYPLRRQLGLKGIEKLKNYLFQITQTRSYIKKIKPDIVNVLFLTDYGFYGALSGFHPFVTTPWGSDILRHPFQKKFWLFSNKFSLKKSDLIFCNSKPMHQGLVKKMQVPENKIMDITWNGIDQSIFNPQNSDKLREKYELNNEVILFSNRSLEPLYNIECILKMFAEFKKVMPNSLLFIAGEGAQKDDLINLSKELCLLSSVNFLGRISQRTMSDYFNLADIFVTIPQSDSCSGSLLEAFACGSTVIASDIEANRSWIQNGQNGWLVNPEDSKKFVKICLNAIRSPLSRKNIEKNQQIIKLHADYFKNMKKVENEFLKLIGSNIKTI